MRYFVDIDGTICNNTNGNYEEAVPFPLNIKKIYAREGKIMAREM